MADQYVSSTGNDTTGNGTIGNPWLTIKKGLQQAAAGDTVWVEGGTYSGESYDSSCNGSSGSPKTVRPYSGAQVVINTRTIFSTGSADIQFIGHDDVRLGRTADTFRFVNSTNSQHVIELYGTRNKIRGCDIDHAGGYTGSCVAMGWNGQTGQWQAVSCEVTYCKVHGIGLDPSYTSASTGHDHGLYLNYNSNCIVSYNLIYSILGGWGIHLYTESGSARDVDGTTVTYNTVYNTRDGGIMLASAGTSTTKNTVVNNNLFSNCGDASLTTGVYTFMVSWGGPTGTGNTGTANHSYAPGDGDVQPGLTGWTLDTPSNGNPQFFSISALDFRIPSGSTADGKGAFPTGVTIGFPVTSILDNFNRANSTNVGTDWVELTDVQILNNALAGVSGAGCAYWNQQKFTDCELYFTMSVISSGVNHYALWRMALASDRSQDPTTNSNWSGYYLGVDSLNDEVRIYKYDGSSSTQLGSSISIVGGVSTNDAVGIRMVGADIYVYYKPTGLVWSPIGTFNDSTYTGAGRLSLEGGTENVSYDDFGGGAYTIAEKQTSFYSRRRVIVRR